MSDGSHSDSPPPSGHTPPANIVSDINPGNGRQNPLLQVNTPDEERIIDEKNARLVERYFPDADYSLLNVRKKLNWNDPHLKHLGNLDNDGKTLGGRKFDLLFQPTFAELHLTKIVLIGPLIARLFTKNYTPVAVNTNQRRKGEERYVAVLRSVILSNPENQQQALTVKLVDKDGTTHLNRLQSARAYAASGAGANTTIQEIEDAGDRIVTLTESGELLPAIPFITYQIGSGDPKMPNRKGSGITLLGNAVVYGVVTSVVVGALITVGGAFVGAHAGNGFIGTIGHSFSGLWGGFKTALIPSFYAGVATSAVSTLAATKTMLLGANPPGKANSGKMGKIAGFFIGPAIGLAIGSYAGYQWGAEPALIGGVSGGLAPIVKTGLEKAKLGFVSNLISLVGTVGLGASAVKWYANHHPASNVAHVMNKATGADKAPPPQVDPNLIHKPSNSRPAHSPAPQRHHKIIYNEHATNWADKVASGEIKVYTNKNLERRQNGVVGESTQKLAKNTEVASKVTQQEI